MHNDKKGKFYKWKQLRWQNPTITNDDSIIQLYKLKTYNNTDEDDSGTRDKLTVNNSERNKHLEPYDKFSYAYTRNSQLCCLSRWFPRKGTLF